MKNEAIGEASSSNHSWIMGKSRRRRSNNRWHRRHTSSQDDGSSNLSEVEMILVEKFLSEYRSLAYDICYRRNSGNQSLDTKPWIIGEHTFPSLTEEFCSRPYIDLPHTLSAKDRRKIHSLCALSMDLYHAGVGQKSKRRIVVSIYADGFRFIPDEDLESSSLCSNNATSQFPHKMCTPWYYLDTNTNAMRLVEIEDEKKLIHQFVKYPEQSLITKSYEALVLAEELENLDLSNLPSVDQTPYDIVDTVDKLRLCIEELKHGVGYDAYTNNLTTTLHELAFDMEMHNQNNTVRTCLIQITANTVQKDYIIDPLAHGMWESIRIHLGPLFSDPSILKIGHGIGGMDCSSLHRDFGILVVNAFDTCEASAIIRQSKGGMNLATLCGHYNLPACEHYRNLKDRFQTANWCQRPLPIEALEYGRYDVRYLITLKKLLTRDLLKLDMVAGVLNDVSEYDSTSVSERINTDETGEHFISSSSEWSSSISDLSVEIDKVRTEAIITVSDLPCFEKLMKTISISQKRCLKLWNGKGEESESILRNQSFTSLVKQSASVEKRCGVWTEQNTKLYKKLADWRAIVAERENIDVSDVCSLDMLVYVAYKSPKNRSELRRFDYSLPSLIDDKSLPYFDEIKAIVASFKIPYLVDERRDVVFYTSSAKIKDTIERCFGRKEEKLMIATTIACIIAFNIMTRKRQ